ncbi:tyrosine-type recombinase/integrase [Brachybacterium hainanense]|uniref:Tyrosine-type recombinase/integrase n=1 Tax=Brachybacterium hainanense TaxID=1541174 RepID=A0ABV6RDG6_9MICO
MANLKLDPGELGDISFESFDAAGVRIPAGSRRRATRVTARARYGTADGGRGRKSASGASKTEAEAKLREAVAAAYQREREVRQDRERGRAIPRDWTGFARMHDEWLRGDDSGLAQTSVRAYTDAIRNYVLADSCPFDGRRLEDIAHLELREWLQGVANGSGNGAAHAVKSTVSGMYKRAVGYGIVPAPGPMVGMGVVKRTAKTEAKVRRARERQIEAGEEVSPERDHGKAIGAEEYTRLYEHLDYLRMRPIRRVRKPGHPRVQDNHTADLVAFMLGTGCRIGEALAVRWEDVDLNVTRPQVTVCGTLSEDENRRVIRQDWTKTKNGMRTIAIPEDVALLLRGRLAEDESMGGDTPNRVGVVFPSTSGGYWDKSNANRRVRAVLDDESVGLSWATSHSFRRTVINDLLDGGLAAPRVAAHVGHGNAAFTLARYGDVRSMPVEAGEVLSGVRAGRKVATKVAINESGPDLRLVSRGA